MKKLCCKELKDALKYEKASFSLTPKATTVLLKLGQITVSVSESKKRQERLLKAIGDSEAYARFKKLKPSGTIPVIKPVKYCPFCGNNF